MYGGNVIKIMSGERKFIIGLKVQKQIALSVLELRLHFQNRLLRSI